MAKVKVTVSNQQTGLQRETLTNDQGTFTVPLLPVGIYLVTAEQAGFKLAMRSDVQLNVDQVQRVNLELSAGNVSEGSKSKPMPQRSTPKPPPSARSSRRSR